nr:ras and Rab interactor-like protein isoform X2 [Marmota flaviventris]
MSHCPLLIPDLLDSVHHGLVLPQANGAGKTPLGVLGTPLLRLQRTRGVWQVPELDANDAKALVELWPLGSFLVTGHDPSQVLVLKTGPSPGEVNTYRIQKLPGGVSLETSNLCMPDLPHLLAFLSASRDVLPKTLILPSSTLAPGEKHKDSVQVGRVQGDPSGRVLSVVNQLYLETHGSWGTEQNPQTTEPETAQRHDPATRNPVQHRVSWVEGPLSPEVRPPGPALASLVEEKEEEEEDNDPYKDDVEAPEDVLTVHVRALARARSSYVARQYRGFRARLTSDCVGSHRPGDPATELLQDVRHLLTDLQDHLSKDPDVRAVFGNRGLGGPQKDEDLGNGEGWKGTPTASGAHSLGPTYVFESTFFLLIGAHTCFLSTRCPFLQVTTRSPTGRGGALLAGEAEEGGSRVQSQPQQKRGAKQLSGTLSLNKKQINKRTCAPHAPSHTCVDSPTLCPRSRCGDGRLPGGAGAAEACTVDATPHAPRPGTKATEAAANSPAGGGGASRCSGGGA